LSENWYGEIKPFTLNIPASCTGKKVLRIAQDDKNSEGHNTREAFGKRQMSFHTLELAIDAGIATITLNRPDKRNAVSFQLVDELLRALDEIKKSPAQVIILTGAGKAFCAGMDLDELKSLLGKTHEQNLQDSSRMAEMFRRLYEFPRPSIAAVNGAAIAGGCGLATMCDFTLAVPEAKFGYTEVRIGFVPALVSSILVWQVGHKIARDLLLTGRLFDAAEGHRLGLVNEVVPAEQLMSRSRELAAQLMENSPSSLSVTKRLVNSFLSKSLDQQIGAAIEENARIRTTDDFREGISSFLEKRKPRWSGQ
jgi:methylglutaconyl-CoA hydratase